MSHLFRWLIVRKVSLLLLTCVCNHVDYVVNGFTVRRKYVHEAAEFFFLFHVAQLFQFCLRFRDLRSERIEIGLRLINLLVQSQLPFRASLSWHTASFLSVWSGSSIPYIGRECNIKFSSPLWAGVLSSRGYVRRSFSSPDKIH